MEEARSILHKNIEIEIMTSSIIFLSSLDIYTFGKVALFRKCLMANKIKLSI